MRCCKFGGQRPYLLCMSWNHKIAGRDLVSQKGEVPECPDDSNKPGPFLVGKQQAMTLIWNLRWCPLNNSGRMLWVQRQHDVGIQGFLIASCHRHGRDSSVNDSHSKFSHGRLLSSTSCNIPLQNIPKCRKQLNWTSGSGQTPQTALFC